MQFYILAPLVIYPLYKKPVLGLLLCACIYTGLTIGIGALVVHYELTPSTSVAPERLAISINVKVSVFLIFGF